MLFLTSNQPRLLQISHMWKRASNMKFLKDQYIKSINAICKVTQTSYYFLIYHHAHCKPMTLPLNCLQTLYCELKITKIFFLMALYTVASSFRLGYEVISIT